MWLGELSRVFFRSVFIYASLLLPKFSFLFSSSCLQLFFWDRFKSEFIVAIVHAERLVWSWTVVGFAFVFKGQAFSRFQEYRLDLDERLVLPPVLSFPIIKVRNIVPSSRLLPLLNETQWQEGLSEKGGEPIALVHLQMTLCDISEGLMWWTWGRHSDWGLVWAFMALMAITKCHRLSDFNKRLCILPRLKARSQRWGWGLGVGVLGLKLIAFLLHLLIAGNVERGGEALGRMVGRQFLLLL